jgi:hypothetical protein
MDALPWRLDASWSAEHRLAGRRDGQRGSKRRAADAIRES